MESDKQTPQEINTLYDTVSKIIEEAQATVYRTANFTMIKTYWYIGRAIGKTILYAGNSNIVLIRLHILFRRIRKRHPEWIILRTLNYRYRCIGYYICIYSECFYIPNLSGTNSLFYGILGNVAHILRANP